MKKLFSIIWGTVLAVSVFAMPSFVSTFSTTYSVSASSKLGQAKCMVCHTTSKGGKLNSYGRDVKTAMGSSKKLTADILKKVESLDSDHNGVKNGEQIRSGSLPGN